MSSDESDHPTTLKAQNRDEKPLCRIGLIYWPVDDAFEAAPDGFGIGRENVSCLYLRILHEITDCVVLPVSASEVKFSLSNFDPLCTRKKQNKKKGTNKHIQIIYLVC